MAERGEIEQFIEGGHAGAGDDLLGGKFGIADCATIPLFDLLECQLVDDGAGDGAVADGRFENGVVRHDDDVVFGDGHVGFEERPRRRRWHNGTRGWCFGRRARAPRWPWTRIVEAAAANNGRDVRRVTEAARMGGAFEHSICRGHV